MGLQLLGSLTPERFLSQYWQKKPMLVRQAIPAFAGIVPSSELFRLAARENVESKLFVRRGAHWSTHDGPHPGTAFARLPSAEATKPDFAAAAVARWKTSGPLMSFLCRAVGLPF